MNTSEVYDGVFPVIVIEKMNGSSSYEKRDCNKPTVSYAHSSTCPPLINI